MLTFPSAPSKCGPETQPSSSEPGNQLWLFSNLSPRFRCVTSFTSRGHISIWGFCCDISEWHVRSARAWTPALMLHLTNPCAKRKVLSLTKPKDKIYKTKSLGHYITSWWGGGTTILGYKHIYASNFILKRGWSICGVWDGDKDRLRQINFFFFSWP